MAKTFRPGFYTKTETTRWNYEHDYDANSDSIWVSFPTYKLLKKSLKEYIEFDLSHSITVIRHRRGEWGEWFEKWQIWNGKPKIYEKGWM